MTEDPSREDDDLARAFRPRRPIGLVVGCFLLGGAGASLYALRGPELSQPPQLDDYGPDVRFVEFDIDDTGQRHKGEEGKMGRPTAKNKSGLYAMRGPDLRVSNSGVQYEVAPDAADTPESVRGGEGYAEIAEQAFVATREDNRSTFAIDVDTASYSNVRRFVAEGHLPPPEAVRIEELVNYFDYEYAQPDGEVPFSVTSEVGPCPWNDAHRLVHIGLQGRDVPIADVPARNLVFLVDVSGSMNAHDKLPLLERSLALLVPQLRAQDRVGIVVYAGASGIVLDSTSGSEPETITRALERLQAGGSTNGGAGIELAYRVAQHGFVEGGINRVVLATDGDFNVGLDSESELHTLIEAKRKSGVFLSVLGFGRGNLQDSTMELLADKGNGNYAYIDSFDEAKKVLVEEVGGTLMTIAKDVKIQVAIDPDEVESFRLIGYDNRKLAHRDFTDDTKDAGEIGSGHSVTALYEVVPARGADGGKLMDVKLRWKAPDGEHSDETSAVVVDDGRDLAATSRDFRFSAAVVEAGLLLRHSEHAGDASWLEAIELANGARGRDPKCDRDGFVALAVGAARLAGVDAEYSATACSP
ncbi:MAG TPA: VWA domain-containing protein [Nannocystaceae bacterium]|nr:VWA domain-containing protein [Nannocystaceae bacterium]